MSVLQSDVIIYGSATMPDDDTPTGIGGAIDTTRRVVFTDITTPGNLQVVSSAAGDTTQTVTVHGRDPAGLAISEGKTLTGQTAVAMTANTTWERIRKAIKSATTSGDIAVETATAIRTGTAQAGSAQTASAMASVTLDTGASATDNAYRGMVVRITSGTGVGQIRRILKYVGATKVAFVMDWVTVPDATSVFRISEGIVFEKLPSEIMEVRKPFYDAIAEASGGSNKKYYEKVFLKNTHATLALTGATIAEIADPSANVAFGLAATLDDTATNGANNRLVAPGGITFDSSTKNVANSQNHTAGAAQGVWLEWTADAGDAAVKTTWEVREAGASI